MQPVIIFADHLQTTLDNQSEIGEKVSVLLIEQFTEQSYDAILVVQAFRQVQGGGQLLLVELVRNGRSHSPLILNLTANTATPAPDIEKPAAITLPEGGLDLFKAIFTDCSRVVIEEEFGGGFSGSYAYGVIPIHQKGGSERRKLRCVVKLASVEITVRETHGYADNMYIPDSPHLVREAVVLANGRFGGLCISRVGGPDLEEVSLGAYISAADSGVEDVAKVMKMTLDLIHSNGESSQPRQQYHLLGGYDKQMPVNLLLRPMPVPNDAQRVVIHANAPPAQAPEVGTYVRLEQFAIVKYDDKDHTVTLNCPDSNTNWMSSYRVRLVEVDPEAYTSIEKNPSVIEGIVVQTRMSQLYQEASRALGPSIDIYAPTYKLSNGLQMPNPIAKLPGLLDERIEIRYGYAHGDLNLENVRIRRSTGAPELIDYAEAGDDHIIRDYLHLETQIMSKIVAPLLHTHQLPVAETIADLYQRLHWAVFYGDQVDVRVWEPALEKPFAALKIVRQAAGEFLFKPYAYREYYLGLALHLIGAQRYGNLNRVPEAPVPKQVLFWGAAEAIALAEEMHEQKDEEKDEQRGRLNPYRGLKFFDVQHADDFFGRETVTLELLAKIRRMVSPDAGNESRFLAIIGPSGSGKSSLARAGVVAALRQGALAGSEQWSTIILRPKDEPLANLAQAVHSGEPPADFMQSLHTDPETLHRHIQQQSSQNAHPVTVLLIDQFEELFTLSQDEAARLAFLQNVLFAATVVNGRILILFTLRADFYGECAAYPRLAQLLSDQQMLIGPMGQENLQAVIEKPALRSVAFFESGLVQTLLDDVLAQTGNLPLLQDALHELWQQQSRRLMTHTDYEKIGRIKGAIQKRAEDFYQGLVNVEEQRTCRQIFLRLVQPGEKTADVRRIATQPELREAWPLVRQLANERLVVTRRNAAGEEQAEVAHEALVQGWPRLRLWLDESREALLTHQRLTRFTNEWVASGKNRDYLISGTRLNQFVEFTAHTELLVSTAEREFVKASKFEDEILVEAIIGKSKSRRTPWVFILVPFLLILGLQLFLNGAFQPSFHEFRTHESTRLEDSIIRYTVPIIDLPESREVSIDLPETWQVNYNIAPNILKDLYEDDNGESSLKQFPWLIILAVKKDYSSPESFSSIMIQIVSGTNSEHEADVLILRLTQRGVDGITKEQVMIGQIEGTKVSYTIPKSNMEPVLITQYVLIENGIVYNIMIEATLSVGEKEIDSAINAVETFRIWDDEMGG